MKILGIDPASGKQGIVGFALYSSDTEKILWSGQFTPEGETLIERLLWLKFQLQTIVDGAYRNYERLDAVAIEQPFVGINRRTAIELAGAVYVLAITAAEEVGAENVHLLTPAEIKLAFSGDAQAGKDKMISAFHIRFLYGIAGYHLESSEHIIDATAAAVTAADRLRLEELSKNASKEKF